MHLPSTPEEVIAFVGHNFNRMEQAGDPETAVYTLTVHDLLSAFAEMQDNTPEAPTVEQAITSLVTALAASKGWMRDYADSVVRDAVDRKMGPQT